MAKANTVKSAFINHLGPVRGLFLGEGNLLVTAFAMNQADFEELPLIPLEDAPADFVETLGNFQKQKMQIEFAVDVMDEWFNVSGVIAFVRPTASSYPS